MFTLQNDRVAWNELYALLATIYGALPVLPSAHVLIVAPNSAYPTIQAAINAAVTGDRILVFPSSAASGSYTENIVVSGKFLTIVAVIPQQSNRPASGSALVVDGAVASGAFVYGFSFASLDASSVVVQGPGGALSATLLLDSCAVSNFATGHAVELKGAHVGSVRIVDCILYAGAGNEIEQSGETVTTIVRPTFSGGAKAMNFAHAHEVTIHGEIMGAVAGSTFADGVPVQKEPYHFGACDKAGRPAHIVGFIQDAFVTDAVAGPHGATLVSNGVEWTDGAGNVIP